MAVFRFVKIFYPPSDGCSFEFPSQSGVLTVGSLSDNEIVQEIVCFSTSSAVEVDHLNAVQLNLVVSLLDFVSTEAPRTLGQ